MKNKRRKNELIETEITSHDERTNMGLAALLIRNL
jgi:hypothetical protein